MTIEISDSKAYTPHTMIDVAVEAAKAAGELAYRYFKTQPKVTYKPDNTPVTQADIEAEKLIRKIITKHFPDHGIIGEELPAVNPAAKYQWVIDPIDGTKDFIRGLPFWGTYLGVLKDQKPIVGVAYYPYISELFAAQKSQGTYLNNKKTRVSKIKTLKEATISHGSVNRFKDRNKLEGLVRICQSAQTRRGFGSLSLNLLLKGQIDIYIEMGGAIQDFAAPSILVEEAGGKFTDVNGQFSLTSSNGLSTNGLLHNQVLKILNG